MDNVFKLSTIAVLAYLVIASNRNKLTIEEVEDHISNVAKNPLSRLSKNLKTSTVSPSLAFASQRWNRQHQR